jgi:4-amino-4-deoxy-L-arabinose transferase-like glycosyltransferase
MLLALLATSATVCLARFGFYTGDSGGYLRIAANLANGNGFSGATQPPYDPEVFRPPMYPLFLAGLMRLGLDVYGIVVVQIVLYITAIQIAMRTTLAVTGNRLAAGLLGLLMAANPALVRWTVSVTAEALCTTLFCLVAWCIVRDLHQATWSNTITLGISIVALFLTRVTYVVLVPLVIGVSMLTSWKVGRLRYAGVLAMIVLVPAALWIGRNLSVMPSEFHPFGIGSGMALWGRAVELQEASQERRTALIVSNRDYQVAHDGTGPALQAKADADLFRAASEVIRFRWTEFVRMTVFLIVFREWVERYDPELPTAVLWVATVGSGTLLGMGYVGIVLIRSRWTLALPLAVLCFGVAAVHAPFATEARYTAPVRPILYMFSALTAAWVAERVIGVMRRRTSGSGSRWQEG